MDIGHRKIYLKPLGDDTIRTGQIDDLLARKIGNVSGWLIFQRYRCWVALDETIGYVFIQHFQHEFSTQKLFVLSRRASVIKVGVVKDLEVHMEDLVALRVSGVENAENGCLEFRCLDHNVADRWIQAFRRAIRRKKNGEGNGGPEVEDETALEQQEEEYIIRASTKTLPKLASFDQHYYFDFYKKPPPEMVNDILVDLGVGPIPLEKTIEDPKKAVPRRRKKATVFSSTHLQRLSVYAPRFSGKKATIIQAFLRGMVCRRKYKRLKIVVKRIEVWWIYRCEQRIKIQGFIRCALARRLLARLQAARAKMVGVVASQFVHDTVVKMVMVRRAAAIRIQNSWQSWKKCNIYLALRKRWIKVQALVRGHAVRKRGNLWKRSAVIVQAQVRGFLVRKVFQEEFSKYRLIFGLGRRFLARKRFLRQRKAVTIIANRFRARRGYFVFRRIRRLAVKTQARFRCISKEKRYREMRSAASVIATFWRMVSGKMGWSEVRAKAVMLQAFARRCIHRLRYLRLLSKTIRIQSFVRMALAKRLIQRVKRVTWVQAAGRRLIHVQRLKRARLGFILLQARVRGLLSRAHERRIAQFWETSLRGDFECFHSIRENKFLAAEHGWSILVGEDDENLMEYFVPIGILAKLKNLKRKTVQEVAEKLLEDDQLVVLGKVKDPLLATKTECEEIWYGIEQESLELQNVIKSIETTGESIVEQVEKANRTCKELEKKLDMEWNHLDLLKKRLFFMKIIRDDTYGWRRAETLQYERQKCVIELAKVSQQRIRASFEGAKNILHICELKKARLERIYMESYEMTDSQELWWKTYNPIYHHVQLLLQEQKLDFLRNRPLRSFAKPEAVEKWHPCDKLGSFFHDYESLLKDYEMERANVLLKHKQVSEKIENLGREEQEKLRLIEHQMNHDIDPPDYWWFKYMEIEVPLIFLLKERYRMLDHIDAYYYEYYYEPNSAGSNGSSSSYEWVTDNGTSDEEEEQKRNTILNPFDDGAFFDMVAKRNLEGEDGSNNKSKTRPNNQKLTQDRNVVMEKLFHKRRRREMENEAACKIQSLIRGFLSKVRFIQDKEEMETAAKVHYNAMVITSLFRWNLAKIQVKRMLETSYDLVDPGDGDRCFYYNFKRGGATWSKPRMLERYDISLTASEKGMYKNPAVLEQIKPNFLENKVLFQLFLKEAFGEVE